MPAFTYSQLTMIHKDLVSRGIKRVGLLELHQLLGKTADIATPLAQRRAVESMVKLELLKLTEYVNVFEVMPEAVA